MGWHRRSQSCLPRVRWQEAGGSSKHRTGRSLCIDASWLLRHDGPRSWTHCSPRICCAAPAARYSGTEEPPPTPQQLPEPELGTGDDDGQHEQEQTTAQQQQRTQQQQQQQDDDDDDDEAEYFDAVCSLGEALGGRKKHVGGRRSTLCVSSEVGCAMGCTFCATGTMGFTADLTAGEIVEQLVHARGVSTIRNVVFMVSG